MKSGDNLQHGLTPLHVTVWQNGWLVPGWAV